jgi:8-oxo-dGTP diphosphatase
VAASLAVVEAAEVAVAGSRHTARGLVIHGGQILMMERWRGDRHYFSVPGGGIEAGETDKETVVREIQEETTLSVRPVKKVMELINGETNHSIYLCEYLAGEPALPPDAPEANKGPNNRFKPTWVPLEKFADLPLMHWQPLRQPILEGLQNGFDTEVRIVKSH